MDVSASNKAKTPRRIVVIIKPKSDLFPKAWDSSKEIIEYVLNLIGELSLVSSDGVYNDSSRCLFLGVERWNTITFVLLDIYHKNYDPDRAHMPGSNDLPVISIRLGSKAVVRKASDPEANKVNKKLEKLHDLFGIGSRPPFFEDHANGTHPVYWRPRKSGAV